MTHGACGGGEVGISAFSHVQGGIVSGTMVVVG